MKNKVGLLLPLVLVVLSLMFTLPVKAEIGGGGSTIIPPPSGGGGGGGVIIVPPPTVGVTTSSYSQIITLQPGWNLVSTPRIVESHQFSAPETSANFSIYLLNTSSSWSTMQEFNQTEFTPLFGYFILNKTTSTQTLTFNYKQDVDPAQRLFDRQLTPGWNVIGIANPTYALRQEDLTGKGYASLILGSTKNCLSTVVDFTAGQTDKYAVGPKVDWNSRNVDDLSSLNNWRDTKAYGVYADSGCSYHGIQNENLSSIIDPASGTFSLQKESWLADQNIYLNTSSTVLIGSYNVTTGNDETIRITDIDIGLASSTLAYASSTSRLSWRMGKGSDNPAIITKPQDNNHFTADILLNPNSSVGIDVYLDISNLKTEDIGKTIATAMKVTALDLNLNVTKISNIVAGQTNTVIETPPPTLNINFNNNSGGYLMGGTLVNSLLQYNISSPDDSVSIKQLYFKVNSSNPSYSAFSTMSANNGFMNNQWLGGSLVSTTTATTTISINELNIARNNWAYITVGGQLSNIGTTTNPSGLETSISLIGARFTDSAGKSHDQYFGDEVYKSPTYVAVAARPYVNLEPVSNSLVLGTSKIARLRMYSSGNDVDAVVRIKSLPLHIITSNARFNTSTNSLVLKNADGTIINTTNTSCMAGDCVINFVEPYVMIDNYGYNLDIFVKDVNFTDDQPGGLSAVTVSLGDKSLFIWDDVKGNLNDIAGMYDNNWPTNTVTTLRSGSEPPVNEVVPTVRVSYIPPSRYLMGGTTENNLLYYYIGFPGDAALIKQMYYKVNSSDANYLPFSNLSVALNGNQRLGSSAVSKVATTTINVNLNITGDNEVGLSFGGQLSNVGATANPSGIVTSISLVGIKYTDSAGIDHVKYFTDDAYKSSNYLVVASKPNIYLNTVSNSLNLGTSRIASISVNGQVKVKSLPLHITTNDATFSTSTDSLIVKNSNGDVLETTNTSCASGDCVVNFVNSQASDVFYLYAKEVNYTIGEWAAISTSMGDKNLFFWDDVVGGLNGITGAYDNNWPIETITTVSSGSGETESAPYAIIVDPSFVPAKAINYATNVVLGRWNITTGGEAMKIMSLRASTAAVTSDGSVVGANEKIYNYSVRVNGTQVGSYQTEPINTTTSLVTFWPSWSSDLFIVAANTTSTIEIRGDLSLGNDTKISSLNTTLLIPSYQIQGVASLQSFPTLDNYYQSSSSVAVALGGINLEKNASYGNQVIAPNTSGVKVGSFVLTAGDGDSIRVTNIKIGLASSTLSFATNTSNLYISENTSNKVSPQATNNFAVDFTLQPNTSRVIDVYMTIGNVTAELGNKIVTSMIITARNSVNVTAYSGGWKDGQEITVTAGDLSSVAKSVDSINSQYVIGGSSNVNLMILNLKTVNSSIVVDELGFKFNGSAVGTSSVPVTSVTVNGVTKAVSDATATTTVTGLNLTVPAGYSGTNVPVSVNYNTVGAGNLESGKYVSSSLFYIKYRAGSQTYTTTTLAGLPVISSDFQIVATKPVVAVVTPTNALSAGTVRVGRITVHADASGALKLKTLPITISTTSASFNAADNALVIKTPSGEILNTLNTPVSSGISIITFVNGYTVSAGAQQTLDIYVQGASYTGTTSGASKITLGLGAKSLFTWDDVNGNATDISGTYYNNWPIDTTSILNSIISPDVIREFPLMATVPEEVVSSTPEETPATDPIPLPELPPIELVVPVETPPAIDPTI